MKITSRDIKFFLIGIFTIIFIDILVDFKNAKKSFMDGYNSARHSNKIENIR